LFSPCFLITDPAPTELYTLSLHDALPISHLAITHGAHGRHTLMQISATAQSRYFFNKAQLQHFVESRFDSLVQQTALLWCNRNLDRKSTRLNSSHVKISYAVFCLKKKKKP